MKQNSLKFYKGSDEEDYDEDFEDDYQLYCQEFGEEPVLEKVRKILGKVPWEMVNKILNER